MKSNTHYITECSIISALYVILTFISSFFGISSGIIQCRLSEALSAFALFSPSGVIGLTSGCLLANIMTGSPLFDIVFGSLATFIGSFLTYKLRKNPFFALILSAISNAVIIPFVMRFGYGFIGTYLYFFLTIFAGEFISCVILGGVLYSLIKKYNIIRH